MFLPQSAEYAIRCMAQMALLPRGSSVSSEELHKFVGVPRSFLSKVLRKLVAAGLLQGERGRSGGFKLALQPSKISFLQIVEAAGFSIEPDQCAFGWGKCNTKSPCPLHEAFNKMNQRFVEWASKTTLADVNDTSNLLARKNKVASTK